MLPIYTTPEDVITVVEYFKTKAIGATLEEAKAAIGKSILDSRKISGYTFWGFITADGDKFRLTERGRKFARASDDGRMNVFKNVVHSIHAYVVAAEWMYHQHFESVSVEDLAAHWHEHIPDDLGSNSERTIRDQVTCFFNLFQAAGLGKYVLGRKGQPTRLTINIESLGQFIAEGDLISTEKHNISDTSIDSVCDEVDSTIGGEGSDDELTSGSDSETMQVFISHGKNTEIVDQVKTMLELADLSYEVVVEEESTAIPVSEKVFTAMQNCTSAVICVTADPDMEQEDGCYGINQNVLIEIGAAFVLYKKKVVLIWDRRINIPSNLQGIYRCEFEGDELTWTAGMKLMKAVNKFKKQIPVD